MKGKFILKFGGTSVGTPDSIKKVKNIVFDYINNGNKIAVVVSAFAKVTDGLLGLAELAEKGNIEYKNMVTMLENRHLEAINSLIEDANLKSECINKVTEILLELKEIADGVFLLKELSKRTLDLFASFGERLSAVIISYYFRQFFPDTEYIDARNIIVTNDNFTNAVVNFSLSKQRIKEKLDDFDKLYVITGFIASTPDGKTTTLGRGGSDYTASIIGNIVDVDEIHIWTDVDGIMTSDPKKVDRAFPIVELSYEEAMELSNFGAKVLYPPTIQPALDKKIPIIVKNVFNPHFPGTKVCMNPKPTSYIIKGISSIDDICILRVKGSGMVGIPGISYRLFRALKAGNVNAILVTQTSSEHSICVAIKPEQSIIAKDLVEREFIEEITNHQIDEIKIENNLSIVAIVGNNMRMIPGISGKVFTALGRNGINVIAISQGSSELNISIVINKKNLIKALNAIHDSFFLSDKKVIHLFLIGTGLIGTTLMNIIKNQCEYIRNKCFLDLRVVGIANSRKMLFDIKGIDFDTWKNDLEKSGLSMELDSFVDKMIDLNLSNSIFIDCTASYDVPNYYEKILYHSIPVVTPNKVANILKYDLYSKLRHVSNKYNAGLFYETNVGAGLPVINTLKDLILSGDEILKIEGIFSGTLSYIFNNFNSNVKFSALVKEAMQKGYTEPDPRIDLKGEDVARKLLILIRELEIPLELEDIQIEPFLPKDVFQAESIDDFLTILEKYDDYFKNLALDAEKKSHKLKYIASFDGNIAKIQLQEIPVIHPFYFLTGTDNIILFRTKRYNKTPLVIKGPGAGAEVTGAGVFADIIKAANTNF